MAEEKLVHKSPPGDGPAGEPLPPKASEPASSAFERQRQETQQTAQQLKEGARGAAGQARRQTAEMGREAKATAREMKDRAMHSAARSAHQAQEQAATLIDDQKLRIAGELETFGAAFARAADQLREGEDDRIASYAEAAADQLHSTADYLRTRRMGELVGEMENFARRRPEVFFGGMLLAGLGVARFLKASGRSRRRRSGEPPSPYGGEYDDEYGSGDDYEEIHGQPQRETAEGACPTPSHTEQSETWPKGDQPAQGRPANDPLSSH